MSDDVIRIFDLIMPIIDRAGRRGAQFAEVRALAGRGTSLVVQDRRAEKMFYSTTSGLGVRVLIDGSWGFASCDGFDGKLLDNCLDHAIALAGSSAPVVCDKAAIAHIPGTRDRVRCFGKLDPDQVPLEKKLHICLDLERQGLAAGEDRIVNSLVGYGDAVREQWVVNSLGTEVYSAVARARVSCQIIAVEGELRQRNYQVVGHQGGPELLVDLAPELLSVKAAKMVLQQLRAKKAPAGEFPVIFHPSISGLLAHEALGHNAEADGVWSGQSILQGRLGEQIANELVTISDDATVAGRYGSEPFDSEGTPTRKRVIIKNGVLNELLHNLETADRFDTVPNGCGRAQDHTCVPLCRMSNTFFESGSASLDDMLAGIDRGIYLSEGHEGYVYPERGQFLCRAQEARMIENGRLGEPLRDVSVSGLILQTLMDIDRVGSDFLMTFPGTCGKGGQGVPSDCGGPHLRVKQIVVGGHE